MDIIKSVVSERDRALLAGDYQAYHAQATRKINAIRRRLGTATPRGRKYTPKAPVTPENVAQSSEWVQLLLASSERSWASAMDMKSSQSAETTQKPMPGSTKRQIASRLRRAVIHAENLVSILHDRATTKAGTTDVLEAKAYLALMKGSLDFEKSRWQSCLQQYSIARVIFAGLSTSTKNDIFKELLTTIVDPNIRYAAYQLKLPRTKPIAEIAVESFPSSDGETYKEIETIDGQAFEPPSQRTTASQDGMKDLPTTITWRSRTVKLEDASISQALGLAQEREKSLKQSYEAFQSARLNSKELAAAYDDVINARQDAVDATKTAIDELAAEGVAAGDPRVQSLQVTRTAVSYGVIEWRVGRTRVLCGPQDGLLFQAETQNTQPKPRKEGKTQLPKEESAGRILARLRERVALYDAILQSLDSVKELPGVMADTTFVQDLDVKRNYFRALKCLAVGRAQSINDSFVNALALYSRALELSQHSSKTSPSSSSSSPDSPLQLDVTEANISTLQTHLRSLVTQYRGLVELKNLQGAQLDSRQAEKDVYKAPLAERLLSNEYEESVDLTHLVTFPPQLQPIPVKPLFFDLAWNYIQYPGKQAERGVTGKSENGKLPTVADKDASQPAKKGWFGFGR